MAEHYLTPKQLSDRWQGLITVSTLANWRSKKKGPVYTRIGGKIAYSLKSVEDFERVNETKPAGK